MSANPVPCSIAVNRSIYEGHAFTVLHLCSAVGFKQQIQIIETDVLCLNYTELYNSKIIVLS